MVYVVPLTGCKSSYTVCINRDLSFSDDFFSFFMFHVFHGSDLFMYWKLQKNHPRMADFFGLKPAFLALKMAI
jgi:hypothetical protein